MVFPYILRWKCHIWLTWLTKVKKSCDPLGGTLFEKKCVRLMDFNSIKFDSMNRSRFFHSPRAPLFTMLESTCTYHVAKRSRFFVHSRGGLFDGNVIVFLSTRSTLSPHLNIDLGGWRGVGKFSSYSFLKRDRIKVHQP